MWIYRDRQEAGVILYEHLKAQIPALPVTRVVALPRGGVVVAAEIAKRLALPLDVLIARKIGAPGNPEFGIGAITEGAIHSLQPEVLRAFHLAPGVVDSMLAQAQKELDRRVALYRPPNVSLNLKDQDVLLVDDGLATGVTARVAIRYVKSKGARSISLAVPVAAADSLDTLRKDVDRMICPSIPQVFRSVGMWYRDFEQVTDGEVLALLHSTDLFRSSSVELEISDPFAGSLKIPAGAQGVVVFAHGSGSSRFSPRNIEVANALNRQGIGTLLLDLLTPAEAANRANVFDIPLLSRRVREAVLWVKNLPSAKELKIGLFGASTGAAAALCAAAEMGEEISAVVSRGGRPDLADISALSRVRAPTLLIVGSEDTEVLDFNRRASRAIPHSRVTVVAGATHLFEESGALEKVAEAAGDWFQNEFRKGAHRETQSAA